MLSSLACSLVLSVGFRLLGVVIFFFKQKTAYEMRISDWSSDVCSSDLFGLARRFAPRHKPDRSGEGVALMDGPATDRGEARLFAGIELGGTKCICTLAAGPDDVRDQQTIAMIGRAHVCTPVTNAHLVCRLLVEKKKLPHSKNYSTTSISY